MTQIFLLIYMILDSESPACHMSDTQHEPHKRENTENNSPPSTPVFPSPPPTFSVTSWALQCLLNCDRIRRPRRSSSVSYIFTVTSHITASIWDTYFPNFFSISTKTSPCLTPVTRCLSSFILMSAWPEPPHFFHKGSQLWPSPGGYPSAQWWGTTWQKPPCRSSVCRGSW